MTAEERFTMNEFKRDDVLAEIGGPTEMFWVVRSVNEGGYYLNSIYKGRFISNEVRMPASLAHNHLLKVDEWDRANMCVKGGEAE